MRHVITLTLILLLGALVVGAQENVQAGLTFEHDSLTIGDVVPLTLSVTHPMGWRVIPPELQREWGDFEVVSQAAPQIARNADGTETTTQRINVQVFNLGQFQTPPLSVSVVDSAGNISAHEAAPASLTVNPTLTGEDTLLRDIKPQVEMIVPPISPLIIGAAVLSVLAVIVAVTLMMGRLRQPPIVVDTRTIGEKTQDELSEIQEMNLLAAGDYKRHYALLSDCIRRYIESIYNIPATDRTTGELRRDLKNTDIVPDNAQFVVDLLATCDLVKFAKVMPSPEEAERAVEVARQFVFMTEPLPRETQEMEVVA
jgi:hypothetical protein